jgi:hypothetical protein
MVHDGRRFSVAQMVLTRLKKDSWSFQPYGRSAGDGFEVGADSLEEAALVEEFFDDFDEVVAVDFDVGVGWSHGC